MDDQHKSIEKLKERIAALYKKLEEKEQQCQLLQENRELLKADRERLMEDLKTEMSYRAFAEKRREKANESFVNFLMECYTSTYTN